MGNLSNGGVCKPFDEVWTRPHSGVSLLTSVAAREGLQWSGVCWRFSRSGCNSSVQVGCKTDSRTLSIPQHCSLYEWTRNRGRVVLSSWVRAALSGGSSLVMGRRTRVRYGRSSKRNSVVGRSSEQGHGLLQQVGNCRSTRNKQFILF
jgi:hypothetical protein